MILLMTEGAGDIIVAAEFSMTGSVGNDGLWRTWFGRREDTDNFTSAFSKGPGESLGSKGSCSGCCLINQS